MISRNYEVVIVDPSPGALIAGALLARASMNVLVLEHAPPPPPISGFRFLRHRPPIPGFQQGLLLQRTLKALKFHPHELQALRRSEPGLQVVNSRHRLDIPADPAALAAELEREFPRDGKRIQGLVARCAQSAASFAEALDTAVEEAGQVGFLHSVGLARPSWNPPLPPEDVPTWGRFLDESELSDEGRLLLRALLRPFCALDVVEDLPLPVAGLHLMAALGGVWADAGEEHALLSLMLRRVRAMRVDVLPERLLRLEGGRRKVDSAVFQGRDEEMPLQYLITGGDPEDLLPLLPGGERAYERTLARLAPSHFRYSIFLGLQGDVLPPDMAEHVVLTDDADPEDRAGCLLISTTQPGSPMAPPGGRAMTVSTLLPYADDGTLPKDLDAVAAKMLDRVKWLVPWLERHVDVLQIPTSAEEADGQPIPLDPRPVAYTPAVPPADDPVAAGLGVFLPHKNVFCAGPAAFPALGLAGEAMAGRLVERLALAGARRPS